MKHTLKIDEAYYDAVANGSKPFEVRFNDRGYQKGDVLVMREIRIAGQIFTGREIEARISYVHSGLGLEARYVVLGLEQVRELEAGQ